MSGHLYIQAGEPGTAAVPAGAALRAILSPCDGFAPSWHAERAERVCAAIFAVLMESQQERVLRSLGWAPLPVPYAAIPPAPEPAGRQCKDGFGRVKRPCAVPVGVDAPDGAKHG